MTTTFQPITEANKQDWINWLGDTLNFLQTNFPGDESNRVFGTEKDDIDEAINIVGTMLVTLQNTPLPAASLITKRTVNAPY